MPPDIKGRCDYCKHQDYSHPTPAANCRQCSHEFTERWEWNQKMTENEW